MQLVHKPKACLLRLYILVMLRHEGDCKVNALSGLPGGSEYWGVFDRATCDDEDTPSHNSWGDFRVQGDTRATALRQVNQRVLTYAHSTYSKVTGWYPVTTAKVISIFTYFMSGNRQVQLFVRRL